MKIMKNFHLFFFLHNRKMAPTLRVGAIFDFSIFWLLSAWFGAIRPPPNDPGSQRDSFRVFRPFVSRFSCFRVFVLPTGFRFAVLVLSCFRGSTRPRSKLWAECARRMARGMLH